MSKKKTKSKKNEKKTMKKKKNLKIFFLKIIYKKQY